MKKRWYTLEFIYPNSQSCQRQWLYMTDEEVERECTKYTSVYLLTPRTDEEAFYRLLEKQPLYVENLDDKDIREFYREQLMIWMREGKNLKSEKNINIKVKGG